MPSSKGHFSCEFCRSRKLRCDRPLPCTSCSSRGKDCYFSPPAAARTVNRQHKARQSTSASTRTASGLQASPADSPAIPSPLAAAEDQQQPLLAEIRALQKLAKDLESRVMGTTETQQQHGPSGPDVFPSASEPYASPESLMRSTSVRDLPPSGLDNVDAVVAHLERVSMGQVAREAIYPDDDHIIFKIDRIESITPERTYVHLTRNNKPTRCVWLPRHDQVRVLLDKFSTNFNYICRIVHRPSLSIMVDNIYRQIDNHEPTDSGHLVLLLSIIAATTHVWLPQDVGPLFSSAAQANAQAPLWAKATLDVLHAAEHCPIPSLEAIQGIIILSFLLCNIEGVRLRYRYLISTGLLLGRELGLHQIDHPSSPTPTRGVVQDEMGRRAWWYLAATDWMLAARYGAAGEGGYQTSPLHMSVNKPANVSDAELLRCATEGIVVPNHAISEPTETSYFLQRLRLAEISRTMVDSQRARTTTAATPNNNTEQIDASLLHLLSTLPPFFQLAYYHPPRPWSSSGLSESPDIFIQAYLLNSIIQTQRCKLHIGYLATARSTGTYTAVSSTSRDTCLDAARQLITAEKQLEKSNHPFLQVRSRLSGILYGIFLAGIVLLMDVCVCGNVDGKYSSRSVEDELGEVLRYIEGVKGHSLAAERLYGALMAVLGRCRTQRRVSTGGAPTRDGLPRYSDMEQTLERPLLETDPSQQAAIAGGEQRWSTSTDNVAAALGSIVMHGSGHAMELPGGGSQMAQNLEVIDLDGFQWDDLFSGIDSSSFF